MASIDTLRASDGSGNASVATIQNPRSPGATTLVVDTVQGINPTFHATMGTPHTFVDPVTSETITVISEATAVDFQGHVDGTNLEIDVIAPGYTDNGSSVNDIVIIKPTTQWADEVADVLGVSHEDDGTLKPDTVDTAQLLDDAVKTAKLDDGAVTPEKLLSGTGTDWAWQSWTPAWTNLTVGNGTVIAKYKQIGKTVICRISFTAGSTSSVGSSPTFTLPVTSVSDYKAYQSLGSLYLEDAATQGYVGYIGWKSTTTANPNYMNSGTGNIRSTDINASNPFSWGTNDFFAGTFEYEAA